MKITYTPNPLRTIIELDEHEKEIFKLKLKVKELKENLGSASVYLDPDNAAWVMKPSLGSNRPEPHTLETLIAEVRKDYLDMSYMYGEGDKEYTLDKRVDELFEHYIAELQGSHAGDCTCFAMSCSKCHAEDMLGLHTTKGLGKHSGHQIYGAFNYKEGDVWKEHTLDEALKHLEKFEERVPRWKNEANSAFQWLKAYKAEHFPDHQGDTGDHPSSSSQSSTLS